MNDAAVSACFVGLHHRLDGVLRKGHHPVGNAASRTGQEEAQGPHILVRLVLRGEASLGGCACERERETSVVRVRVDTCV